jgi:hypothetical protein
MLTIFSNKAKFYNKKLIQAYCLQSTNNSIQNIIKHFNKERNNENNKLLNLVNDGSGSALPNPKKNNLLLLLSFLSASSFLYYFYRFRR